MSVNRLNLVQHFIKIYGKVGRPQSNGPEKNLESLKNQGSVAARFDSFSVLNGSLYPLQEGMQ